MRPTPHTTHSKPEHTAIAPRPPDDVTPPVSSMPPHLPAGRQDHEHEPVKDRAAARTADAARAGPVSNRFLAKATLLSAALTVAGSLLGLGRDQTLARFFGASTDTDAFLVAWTVPEMAATLLIEGGIAFALVPAFSVALARRASGVTSPDPVRVLIAASLPRLCLALAAVAAVFIAGAPVLVSLLAPGLPDPSLAVDCTRLTSTAVLSFGLAGYCSAALRAHRSYLAPAAVSVALNIAIIAAMFVLGGSWGVRSAALGVALGGCLMVLIQAPTLWRRISDGPRQYPSADVGTDSRPLSLAIVAAVLLFALFRQSQVLIERYFAAGLPAGSISHLNYAQKVAQLPMSLALMLCVVTFPVLAQAIAEGDTRRARDRIEQDLVLVAGIALLGAAAIVACAPQIIQFLFQRGAFTAADTAATASVMRVYTLGLLGHTMVGALVRSYFSTARATWYPTGVMAAGMVVTAGISAWSAGLWGARGIAAANAVGITLAALLLLHKLGSHSVPVRVRRLVAELSKLVGAAVGATGAGLACASPSASPLASIAMGCVGVSAVFLLLTWILDAAGARSLMHSASLTVRRSLTRKFRYGR